MNFIEHILEPDHLLLAWQAGSVDRTRYVVGDLYRRIDCRAVLAYRRDDEELVRAQRLGFQGYPAFKRLDREYDQGVLKTFMRRLPPRNRNDFGQYLRQLRIPDDAEISDFALLGYSEARLPGDGFSLINPFDAVDGPCEFLTEIAGFRYQETAIAEITLGEFVEFRPEPENPHDDRAIAVYASDHRIGYINRAQITAFHGWLAEDRLSAVIERISDKPDHPRVFLFVSVAAQRDVHRTKRATASV